MLASWLQLHQAGASKKKKPVSPDTYKLLE